MFRCFSKTTLEQIIKQVLSENAALFPSVNIDIKTTENIEWAMQLQESDFDFLKRKISESATLEMWFDGACLHIANITDQNEVATPLEHGVSLDHPEIALDVSPLAFTVKAYDFINGKMQRASSTQLASANPLIDIAINNSPYPQKEICLPHGFDETTRLDRIVRKMAGQQAHTLYHITAESNQPQLKIGSPITLQLKENFLAHAIENETFVITSISHTIDEEGGYENSFQAIPKSIPYNLAMETAKPITCGPRAAIVVDNKDPKNLGRCKVVFIGDPNQATSPWLRCLTASTHHGGLVGIPKVKEQVLIFSEALNPERSAFIMGSFWFKNQDAQKCPSPESMMGWYFKNGAFWYDERDGSFNINAQKIKIVGGKIILEGTDAGTFINCGEE